MAVVEVDVRAVARQSAAAGGWRWATIAVTVGAIFGAALLAPTSTDEPGRLLAWLLFFGSSVHVASTGWFLKQRQIREHAAREDPTHLIALPLGIAVIGVLAGVLMPADSLRWLLLPFFAWQFHHFQRQNIGLIALTARSSGVDSPLCRERRIVMAAGICGIVGLIADPNLLQLGIYRPCGDLTDLSLVVYAALVVAGLFALLSRAARERPPSYCAMYMMALVFPLPIFLFRSPYAAVGGMTIGHGLQYLILVGLVAKGGESSPRGHWELVWLAGIALAGGVLLAVTSHLHASDSALFRGLFGLYLGVVCSHFVVDARLWRLSRPFARTFLASRIPYLVSPAPHGIDRLPIDRLPI